MRIIVLSNQFPYPTGFGSAVHLWSITETLIKRGHEVHFCCYGYDKDNNLGEWYGADVPFPVQKLKSKGVMLYFVPKIEPKLQKLWPSRMGVLRKILFPTSKDYYSGALYTEKISEIVSKIAPDAIVAWTVDSVAALPLPLFSDTPRMVSLVDLDHLVRAFKRIYKPTTHSKRKYESLLNEFAQRNFSRIVVNLLRGCDIVVDHAAQHCRWLQSKGLKQVNYFPVPVLDSVGTLWRECRLKESNLKKKMKVSLIGNVNGIATLSGLYFFANEIIPEIERLEIKTDFEIDIIGGGEIPAELLKAFDRPYIIIRGYVDDIQKEYLSTDVLFVPTPIDLGFRTRISEGFSFGCCVVAHSANAAGMPEIHDGKNALLASSGNMLTDALVKCLNSAELRYQLGTSARETFERELDGEMICTKMIEQLETLI